MDENLKFVLFKKLLIFGGEGVGKTSFTSALSNKYFKEEEPSKNSK